MDNEFELRMRAARGDPEALEQLEKERQRMRIQVEAARAAWGFPRSMCGPTILTGAPANNITVSANQITVRDGESVTETVGIPGQRTR